MKMKGSSIGIPIFPNPFVSCFWEEIYQELRNKKN